VKATDVSSLEDIRCFPLLGKDDVFTQRERLVSQLHEGKLFRGTTSGSTGLAMSFHYDSYHAAWVEACQWRGRRWWSLERGDRQLILWARPVEQSWKIDFATWLKYRLRNCIQFNTFCEFDDEKIAAILAALRRFRPRLIYGYGSSIGRLAEGLSSHNEVLAPAERPLLVEYTADHMSEAERQTATSVFCAPVITAYGASECGGIAQECRLGRLHVSVDHVLLEFLRADGSAAEEGESAEIVVTTLHNFAMPLIRYRVGDLGSFSSEKCACGVNLPVMTLQAGKAVDLISTSSRLAVSAHVLDYINLYLMKHGIRGIKQFFVEQTSRDAFVLSIVQETPFDERSVQVFVGKMRDYLGERIEVDTRFVESIPLQPSGKRRYFKKNFHDDSASAAAANQ
jgi:phenylacetate-CoA ligase